MKETIDAFLAGAAFAVAGASRDRRKYGNKILRCYQQAGRRVFPVNPNAAEVEGLSCYPNLAALPEPVHGVSVITQPDVTEAVVEEAASAGVKHVWMQPGAESRAAVEACRAAGISVIHGGPCLLVVLGFRDV